jgi:hypothetical protein
VTYRHKSAKVIAIGCANQTNYRRNPQNTTIAVDLAKSVFEIGISDRPGHVAQHRLSRNQLAEFFASQASATVIIPVEHSFRVIKTNDVIHIEFRMNVGSIFITAHGRRLRKMMLRAGGMIAKSGFTALMNGCVLAVSLP